MGKDTRRSGISFLANLEVSLLSAHILFCFRYRKKAGHKQHKRNTIVFAKSVKLVPGGQLSKNYECCVGMKII